MKFDSRHVILQAATAETVQDKSALRPPFPEIPPTFWEQYHWWIILSAAIVSGSVVLIVWLMRRPKADVIVPIEIKTREELQALRHQPENRENLITISRCLRRYLAIAFDLPRAELTTMEWNRVLTASQIIGPELSVPVVEFFQQADRLKFAPGPGVSSGTAQRALELVEIAERRRAALRAAATPPAA